MFLGFLKSPEIPDYTDYEPITRITNAESEKEFFKALFSLLEIGI
jgi:hypothetical protein